MLLGSSNLVCSHVFTQFPSWGFALFSPKILARPNTHGYDQVWSLKLSLSSNKGCITITAVQWFLRHKTDSSTAYSRSNTQPTAWDLFPFILWWRGRLFYCLLWVVIVFYYDLGILASTRDEAATSSFHLSECSENHETPLSTILTVNPTAWLSHFVYRPWVWIPVVALALRAQCAPISSKGHINVSGSYRECHD